MKINSKKIFVFSSVVLLTFIWSGEQFKISYFNKNDNKYNLIKSKINLENFYKFEPLIFQNGIKNISLINMSYITSNPNFFLAKNKTKIINYYNLFSQENVYFIDNVDVFADGKAYFTIETNKTINPNDLQDLQLTFDHKDTKYNYQDDYVNNEVANLIFLGQSDNKKYNSYNYEVKNLSTNGEDYFDFNFYLDSKLIFSSFRNNDMHYMTPFTQAMIIRNASLVNSNYSESTIEINTLFDDISYQQAKGIKIRYNNKKHYHNIRNYKYYDLNLTSKETFETYIYTINNLKPMTYKNAKFITTNIFKYNYLTGEYYPYYEHISKANIIPIGNDPTIEISYDDNNSPSLIKKMWIKDKVNENKLSFYFLTSLSEISNMKITFSSTNDYFDSKTFNEINDKNLKPLHIPFTNRYFYKWNFNMENGFQYSNFNFYINDSTSTSYSLNEKYMSNFSTEGKILSHEIVQESNGNIIFNLTFENTNYLQAENIAVSYEANGETLYSSVEDNLNVLKMVSEDPSNGEVTFQYELTGLNYNNYTNFNVYIPNDPLSYRTNENVDFIFDYNYDSFDYYFGDDFFVFFEENQISMFIYFIPVIIVLIVVALLLNHKYKVHKKNKKMSGENIL